MLEACISMDDRVRVKRVTAAANHNGGFRFYVELQQAGKSLRVVVSAQDLLDFDRFQTAALEQTGRLIMAPCASGAEGPENYRRHRRAWCDELQAAVWDGAHSLGPSVPFTQTPSPVPAPKSKDFASDSTFRHG